MSSRDTQESRGETNHTPEPWHTESMTAYYAKIAARKGGDWAKGSAEEPCNQDRCAGIWADDRHAEIVTTDSGVYGPSMPDARRIVACVNACAGISTEELERGLLRDRIDGLVKELRKALGASSNG